MKVRIGRIHNKRGVALIITLGVLFLLIVLALALAILTGQERGISISYLNKTQSGMVAASGMHEATTRLRTMAADGSLFSPGNPLWRAMQYWGDVTDENALNARPNVSTPLADAKNPSFAVEDENPQNPTDGNTKPKLITTADGVEIGYSGVVASSSHGLDSDIYSVKVSDIGGRIYINDGLEHTANSASLRRLLNNLGKVSTIDIAGLGDKIIDNRPKTGYRTIDELKKYLTDDEFGKVRNSLTAHAWIDPAVVNPVPLSPTAAADYLPELIDGRPVTSGGTINNSTCLDAAGRIYRYGRGKNRRGKWISGSETANLPMTPLNFFNGLNLKEALVYGVDELNPCYIEVTSRAPVNINTASYEVLVALFSGLQGFFVLETPSDTFGLVSDGTADPSGEDWRKFTTYDAVGGITRNRWGDSGVLYKTDIIDGPTGGGTSVVTMADKIADAIIQNRNKKGAAITKEYEGPFTSWAQFNRFIDSLVKTPSNPAGIIEDDTGRFASYDFDGGASNYSCNAVVKLWQNQANKAMADVIKANFNPNLHLNELNPDEPMYLLVDKTDLIVWSTEFCFVPHGYFEIESLGRVMNPVDSSGTGVGTTTYQILAESSVRTVVKVFDAHRDCSQKDFYGGKITADGVAGDPFDDLPDISAAEGYRTSGNLPLMTGPEPDNGVAADENNAEGYIQLATMGGSLPIPSTSPTASKVPHLLHKPKGAVWETPRGDRSSYSLINAHYDYDFDLDFAMASPTESEDWRRRSLTRVYNDGSSSVGGYPIPNEGYNFADWSELTSMRDNGTLGRIGPYCYVDSPNLPAFSPNDPAPNATRYRLFRTYTRPTGTGVVSVPVIAPADLRGDGYYGERHNGIPYWPGTNTALVIPTAASDPVTAKANVWITNIGVSMWVKPNFYPEITGKEHGYYNHCRVTGRNSMLTEAGNQVHSMYASFFIPYHRANDLGQVLIPPAGIAGTFYGLRPRSWIFGSTWSYVDNPQDHLIYTFLTSTWSTFATWVNGTCSYCINHGGHSDADTTNAIVRDKFKGHRWMHIAFGMYANEAASPPLTRFVLINGVMQAFGAPNDKSWKYNTAYPSNRGFSAAKIRTMWNLDFSYATLPKFCVNPVRVGLGSLVRNQSDWAQFVGGPGIPEQSSGWPPWNYSPDSTIDEFTVWSNPYGEQGVGVSPSPATTYIRNQARLGRYYRGNKGRYTSRLTDLSSSTKRILPPASAVPQPGEIPITLPPLPAPSQGTPRLLGISATILTEDYRFSGDTAKPLEYDIYDYYPQQAVFTASPNRRRVLLEFRLSGDGGTTWGCDASGTPLFVNPDFASVRDSANRSEALKADLAKVKYDIKFSIEGLDTLNAILLSTPVVDDVTIFFTQGDIEIMESVVL